MRLKYTPEGTQPLVWDFTVGDLLVHEAEAMERQTGLSTSELGTGLKRGSAQAIHALLWVFLRRDPGRRTLKYDDVSFRLSEVSLDLDPGEKRRVLEVLEEKVATGAELDEDEQTAYDVMKAEVESDDPKVPTGD